MTVQVRLAGRQGMPDERAQRATQRARDRLGYLRRQSEEEDKRILVQSSDDGEPKAMKKDTDSDSDRDSEHVGNHGRGRMTLGPRRPATPQG